MKFKILGGCGVYFGICIYIYIIGLAYFWRFKILDLDIETGGGGGGGGRKIFWGIKIFVGIFHGSPPLGHFYISQMILGSFVRSRLRIDFVFEGCQHFKYFGG